MNIYRDGKAIELTEQEICDIYLEERLRSYGEEVLVKFREEYDIDPNAYDINWKQIASDIINEIAEDDTIWCCEQDIYKRVIERYLKEMGD